MKKLALTNYYNFTKKKNDDHICPHCSRKIKKWALSQCSSCNRFFCRSHMEPSIGSQKKCPGCRQHQQEFVKSEPVFGAMRAAESKIQEFRLAESQEIEQALFASIFGNKNLFKYAEEEQTEQPAEQIQVPQTPIQEEQNEPEVSDANMAAEELAYKINEKLDEFGLHDKDSVAQILNAIFADDNSGKTITAQIATPTVVDDSFKGNPMLDLAKASLPYQPQYQPYGQLSPFEAQALDNIYRRYVSYYGTDFFVRLPETPENLQENFKRQQIFGNFIDEVERIAQNPAKIQGFFQRMGLDPARIQILMQQGY
jgi:predicted amidophosphoribosyltransferase